MTDFKIQVTPQESVMVQKLLFLAGYSWSGGDTKITLLDKPYLYFNYNHLTWDDGYRYFEINSNPKLSFEQFLDQIELELNNKTQEV